MFGQGTTLTEWIENRQNLGNLVSSTHKFKIQSIESTQTSKEFQHLQTLLINTITKVIEINNKVYSCSSNKWSKFNQYRTIASLMPQSQSKKQLNLNYLTIGEAILMRVNLIYCTTELKMNFTKNKEKEIRLIQCNAELLADPLKTNNRSSNFIIKYFEA